MSTKVTIASLKRLGLDGNTEEDIHVYTDLMDDTEIVHISHFAANRTNAEVVEIIISKELWNRLTEILRAGE